MKRFLPLLFTLFCGAPLWAHPHIFVDTGLAFRFDDKGQLAEIEVTWAYDEFYSLLITEDRGLDPDFDGILTEDEKAQLVGFDMNWTEGFNGDLVIVQNGTEIALSAPRQATARFEDGRIITTHVRTVQGTVAVGPPIEAKPYDPTYYTAYDVTLPVTIDGTSSCRKTLDMPDIDARLRELQGLLMSLDTQTTPEEEGLPDIGSLMATTVIVTCDMS